MELQRLETFRNVARLGSLAAAARLEGCAASVVSRSLSALEADLGLRLFQRTTRRLELTEAGERYLRRVEPLIEELVAARDEARGLVERPSGRLRITASNGFGQTIIAPLLREFRERYPQVALELILTDALMDLVAERVDVAFRLGPQPIGDFVVARLASPSMRVVAHPDYLRKRDAIKEPRDVCDHACLLSVPQARTTWLFRRGAVEEPISVVGSISTSNTLVLKRCALDGLGVAVLADWLVEEDVRSGRLQNALSEWKVAVQGVNSGIWLVYPSRSFLPSKTRAFIDLVKRAVAR